MKLRRWLAWDGLPLLLGVLAVFGYLSFAQDLFADGDTSWHLAAGRLILASGSVPTTDPFSFTYRGSPWTAHEWLAEVLMAGAFELGSWAGLALLTAGAVAILLLILGAELGRWLQSRHVIAVLAALFIVLAPAILARPHILAWPLLAGWTVLLLRAREEGRAPPLAALAVMLVWANAHGSFIFGLLMIGVFGLEAVIEEEDRWKAVRGWVLFGSGALVAALVTPAGIDGLIFPFEVSSMRALDLIDEWRPSSLSRDPLFFLVAGGALILMLAKRPRLSLPRWLLLGGLCYLALAHGRHQALLAIVGTLVVASAMADPALAARKSRGGRAALLALPAFLILVVIRLSVPVVPADSSTSPRTAIAALPVQLRSQPVFNSYAFGGPLILNGVAPFIDGRADMYGDEFTFLHHDIAGGDREAFSRAVERWKIRWTILHPGSGLAAVLDRDPAWQQVYADEWAVVHVHQD